MGICSKASEHKEAVIVLQRKLELHMLCPLQRRTFGAKSFLLHDREEADSKRITKKCPTH